MSKRTKPAGKAPTRKGAAPVAGAKKAGGSAAAGAGGARAAGTFSGGWKDEDFNEGGADNRRGGRSGR